MSSTTLSKLVQLYLISNNKKVKEELKNKKDLCNEFKVLYHKAGNEVRVVSEDQLTLIEKCKIKIYSTSKKFH